MTYNLTLPAQLNDQALFLVWGPPSHGPRSQVFARELGIDDLHFIYSTNRRGLLAAPLKYSYQAIRTLLLLFKLRPKLVFVQSPPSFAVIFVYLYCALMNGRYVVDAHSDAMQSKYWTRPQWLYRYLARKAVTTIVTNEVFQQRINSWGAHALVLRDIPTTFPKEESYPVEGTFNVVVVNTFASDEPLTEVLHAAAALNEVDFYVTGKKSRAGDLLLEQVPGNVHFTDYLPNERYYALLASCQTVMCLTTRDNTMQRGACEALSLGKPIVTSDWPLLREYFHAGTVHVPNDSESIRQGVEEMQAHYDFYRSGIKDLQILQRQEWQKNIQLLIDLIKDSI